MGAKKQEALQTQQKQEPSLGLSVYKAIKDQKPKLREYDVMNAIDVVGEQLDAIGQMVGAPETPSNQAAKIMVRHIILNYRYLKPQEISLAFECAMQGKFDVDFDKELKVYGKSISLLYVTNILNKYIRYRRTVKPISDPSKLLSEKEDLSPEELNKIRSEYVNSLNDKYSKALELKHDNSMFKLVYIELQKRGLVGDLEEELYFNDLQKKHTKNAKDVVKYKSDKFIVNSNYMSVLKSMIYRDVVLDFKSKNAGKKLIEIINE